jgi:hypothetical protein
VDQQKLYIPITLLLALSALFLTFWVTVCLYIIANILYRNYYAGLIIIFIVDAVYSFELFRIGPVYGMLTIGALAVFLLVGALRESVFISKRL